MIDIGYYMKLQPIEWLTKKGAGIFDALVNVGVESFYRQFQLALFYHPFLYFYSTDCYFINGGKQVKHGCFHPLGLIATDVKFMGFGKKPQYGQLSP